MVSPLDTGAFIKVALNFKLKASPYTIVTYTFSSRPAGAATIYPLIQSISGFGGSMGPYIADDSSGSIQLDNSTNSLGFNLRVSDLFDRYTVTAQTMTISLTTTDGLDAIGASTVIWTGEAEGFSIDLGSDDTVTIRGRQTQLAKDIFGAQISTDIYTAAPSNSLGKLIPFVFGADVQVPAVQVDSNSDAPKYAYAANICDTGGTARFPNGGVQNYYVKDRNFNNEFREVVTAGTVSTVLFTASAAINIRGALLQTRNSAHKLNYTTVTNNYIVTHCNLIFDGQNDGAYTVNAGSKWIVELWDRDAATNMPIQRLATAEALKSNYLTELRAAPDFPVYLSFDKPTPLTNPSGYFINFSETLDYSLNVAGDGDQWCGNTTVIDTWYFPYADNAVGAEKSEKYWEKSTHFQIWYELFGVKLDDQEDLATNKTKGIGTSQFFVTQPTVGPGQTNSDLSKLDFIVSIDGLKDNAGGTLTGTANKLLEDGKSIIQFLDAEFDGSNWASSSKFDFTRHSGTHASAYTVGGATYRGAGGYLNNRITKRQFMEELARNSASRITVSKAGKYGIWAWGTSLASVATLTEFNCNITKIEFADLQSVVTDLDMIYSKYLLNSDLNKIFVDGRPTQYSKQINWRYNSNGITTALTTDAYNVFGNRPLKTNNYDLLGGQTDWGEVVAEFLLGRFGQQHVYIDVTTPGVEFLALELLDIVTVNHPDLPAHYGTSPNAQLPYSTTSSTTAANLIGGQYWRRAKESRAQVEAIAVDWAATGGPEISLRLRLLTQYPTDPT